MTTTAETIKKIRLSLCMSQAEFSKVLAITGSSISLYERDLRKPSFATIRKILLLAKKHNMKITLHDIRPDQI